MDANRHRGEVSFVIDGKQYIARVGTNELATLEDAVPGEGFVLKRAASSTKNLRTMARICLSRHQPELTDFMVGDLLDVKDEAGNSIVEAMIAEAAWIQFPRLRPTKEELQKDGGAAELETTDPNPAPATTETSDI